MAEINRITSFKTFSEIKATQVATQLAEENATKRSELATKISTLLDEMEITSFEDLAEDTKREFITKAFGNVSEEEVEVEVSDEIKDEDSEEVTEGKEADEAEAILSDLLGERDMDELRGMSMEDALDTVGAYGHKGSKAKKIAQELVSMTNESVINEAKELFQLDIDSEEHGALGLSVTMKELKDVYKKNKKNINDVEDLLFQFVYAQPEDFAAIDTEGMEISGANVGDVQTMLSKEFGIKENVQHELNEAIIVTGKRGAKKVFNQLVKIWNEYPAFGANDQSHKLGVLKQLFFDAMEDANFSREAYAILKTIKGNIKPVTIKVAELGGVELKLPMPKIRQAISELASRIATAGEWGGITIVEGTAMFLDYLKETKTAENLLNGFNAQFESVQIMESRVSEGRAFVAAARKAKDEGLEEFEYDGKTYPVLLKETKTVLNEGTRGQFGKIDKKGNITSVYMHYDSYPENILPIIKQSFKGGKNVDVVISKGNNSGLDKNVDAINYYNDESAGETGNVKKIDNYLKTASNDSGAEYVYLWDEGSKTWMMADIYGGSGLVPAFESVVTEIEEIEEGNAFGDAVKKAKEAGEKEFEFEGETFKVEESEEIPVIESCETCGEQTCECASEEVEEAKVNENPALVALAAAELLKKKEEEARPEDEEEEVNAEEDEVEEDELEESALVEAKSIKVTKKEWPYVEFKIGSTKHKVEFDYEDIIDDHGNEGQDQFWLGKDDDGKEWSIDVYADYNGDVQDVHYDTIVAESVIAEGKSGVNTFLANIANDYQFDKKHDHYSGFLNTEPSDMGDDAIEFINNVDKYKSLMKKHGLSLEPGYSDKEAIFVKESVVNEAEIKSDEEFTEYANTVLKQAFGEDFDEAKAKEVIDGILSKSDGDYGAAVGMLTSSLG